MGFPKLTNRSQPLVDHVHHIVRTCLRAQCCQYLIYSEADFEVSRPWATRCTDRGEIWHGEGPLLPAKFHPHWCNPIN